MKIMLHTAVLATAFLCATAAFAANRAEVTIPFNFAIQGHSYPAGQYVATVDTFHNVLTLSSATDTKVSVRWITGPADSNPGDEKLILNFDDQGSRHTLRAVQLGAQVTKRLDTHSRHEATNAVGAVSGQ